MNRSRQGVYIFTPNELHDLRHGGPNSPNVTADYAANVCRGNVAGDGVTSLSTVPCGTSFYAEASIDVLEQERLRLAKRLVDRDPVWKWGLHI